MSDTLGYKRLIMDYHFSDFVPGTLAEADANDTVHACVQTGADSVLVYAKDHWGNCYYATDQYPRHPNVPQDLFGEILAGLAAEGITGYAYFSVGWDEHAVRAHPDWAMRCADGAPLRRGAPPDDQTTGRWTFLCLNSPYRDYALDQIREIVAQYDFPALFLDIVFLLPHYPPCTCDHCRALWAKIHDNALPDTITPEFLDFAFAEYGRFFRQVKAIIAASGKSIQITHNFGLPYDEDDYVAFEINPLGRNYLRGSASAKIMRAEANGRSVELIGHRFNQDWDFTTKSPVLMRWEAATTLAHNCALMWVDQPNMNGRFDPKAIAAINSSFEVVDDLRPHLADSTPYAEIALLYPTRSILLNPAEEQDFVGAYRLLTELHWPFDVVTEDSLSQTKKPRREEDTKNFPEETSCPSCLRGDSSQGTHTLTTNKLHNYQLLIIPTAHFLLPQTQTAVTHYLQNGGHLFFTGSTAGGLGLVEIGDPLPHPASFILPDAAFKLHSAHLRVTESWQFTARGETAVHATTVLPNITVTGEQWVSHNVAPGAETGLAAVVSGEMGNGRYTYAAPRLFAETMRQNLPAIKHFLTALLRQLAAPTIWVEAPGAVEATFNRQGDEWVVCLINGLTGRAAQGGVLYLQQTPDYLTIDEVIPIHNIQVCVRDRLILDAEDKDGNALTITGGETAVSAITLNQLDQYNLIRMELGG
ncbi:MAG: hypothetical protein H6662_11350 [Ardenticatenaceae bacterium]|nr:hypothetical protein [Ardenticatenaceae bacterium]